MRIVLKEALQFDPLLDLLLNRLGCCFVPSGSGGGEDVSQRLGQMARQLGPGDAILIFPEGGNWTPDRRRRAIRRLRKEKKIDAANAASLMSHVLPARPGGVLACLEANPGIDIVVVAHAGLDKITRVRQAWDELPLITPMTVRAWPTAPVPHGDDQRLAWLTLEWAVVDEWIDGFHEGVLN